MKQPYVKGFKRLVKTLIIIVMMLWSSKCL